MWQVKTRGVILKQDSCSRGMQDGCGAAKDIQLCSKAKDSAELT